MHSRAKLCSSVHFRVLGCVGLAEASLNLLTLYGPETTLGSASPQSPRKEFNHCPPHSVGSDICWAMQHGPTKVALLGDCVLSA